MLIFPKFMTYHEVYYNDCGVLPGKSIWMAESQESVPKLYKQLQVLGHWVSSTTMFWVVTKKWENIFYIHPLCLIMSKERANKT